MVTIVLGAIGAALFLGGVLIGRQRKLLAAPFVVVGAVLLAGAALSLVLLRSYRIPSEAMVPTLQIDDRISVLTASSPGNGDIAVFHPPVGAVEADGSKCGAEVSESELCPRPAGGRAEVTFVKRVVGVGGDEIRIQGGRVIRNGEELDEPYARPCGTGAGCDFPAAIRVPRGQLYLLGDNRGFSDDSRFWGPVPEDWVVGKAILRTWPLDRVGAP